MISNGTDARSISYSQSYFCTLPYMRAVMNAGMISGILWFGFFLYMFIMICLYPYETYKQIISLQ